MNIQKVFMVLFVVFVIISCAKIYYSPDVTHKANAHKTISVMPPVISILSMEEGDYSVYKNQMKLESEILQKEMFSWMSNFEINGVLNVTLQDPEKSNQILKEIGYFNGKQIGISEVCEALGVDGMITSFYGIEKPLVSSDVNIVQTASSQNNQANVHLELYDGFSKKVIWSYKNKMAGSNASNSRLLVSNIMKQSFKKMPYYVSKKDNAPEINPALNSDK